MAMRRSILIQVLGVALAVATASCGPAAGPAPAYALVPASMGPGKAMIADRLFFGRAIPGGGSVSEEEWAAFLAQEITPRFPEGLTVWHAEGQWTDSHGQLVRESVLVVEVLRPAGPRADQSLTAVAREYQRCFRQGAVLRVTTPALSLLYE